MRIKKDLFFGIFQIFIIFICGIIVQDTWYKIIISMAGITFNYLVSCGKRWGFIVGICYAAAYGIMSFSEKVYASAIFMILLQLPMGIVSFITWKNDSSSRVKLQKLSAKYRVVTALSIVVLFAIIYLTLKNTSASSSLFDSFFFATSLVSCVLLAKKKSDAYFVIMLSGIAGTLLWTSQLITAGNGISVLLLNFFVLTNSIKGIRMSAKQM